MNISFIALRVTRYSDRQSILSAFSRELGRISLALPAGTGKSAARIRALTMPMSFAECVTSPDSRREILPMRDVRPLIVFPSLHTDPVRQMLCIFTADILSACLRDAAPDPALFDYIASAMLALDAASPRGVANFHITFLSGLTRILGIEPDVSTFAPHSILDMRDGLWRASHPLHSDALTPEESHAAFLLSRISFANMHKFMYTRDGRAQALDLMLRYFSIHHYQVRSLKSLDILRTML